MSNLQKGSIISALPANQQAELLGRAARNVVPRSIRRKTASRFYAHECGLSRSVIKAMRAEGHGEKIFTGKGRNSGRRYFPIEILDCAVAAVSSAHGRLRYFKAMQRAE